MSLLKYFLRKVQDEIGSDWIFVEVPEVKTNRSKRTGFHLKSADCSFFVDFTVERTGEYRSRHEWLLADKDVVQELILYIKRLFSNQIHRK